MNQSFKKEREDEPEEVCNRQQIFDLINFELNKKINGLESKEHLNESDKNTDLLRGLDSNGHLMENSGFNFDDIPIPIHLNFTQSVASSIEVRTVSCVTGRGEGLDSKLKHDFTLNVLNNPSFECHADDTVSSKGETNKTAKSLEKFVELERLCSQQVEQVREAQLENQQQLPDIQSNHYQQTIQTIQNLHLIKAQDKAYKEIPPVFLPPPTIQVRKAWQKNFKVLFLDIDETMIHCIDENDPPSMQG